MFSDINLVISGVYLALGVMYLRFWSDERARKDYLAFAVACLAYMIFSLFELGEMHSQTGQEYLGNMWWAWIPGTVALIAIAWFVRVHHNGRPWLFWTYCGLRIVSLALHLTMKNGMNFREMSSVGRITILGETISYPLGVPNPWQLIPHFSHLVLVIFSLDASVRLWRSGEVRRALVFGSSFFLFGSTILVVSIGVLWGLVPLPLFSSAAIFFIIAAMFWDLNYNMHRAAMLTDELAERESELTDSLDQLRLAAAAANVGIFTRKLGGDMVLLSEKAAEILGLQEGKQVTRDGYLQHLHPDDRVWLAETISNLEGGQTEFEHEYRVIVNGGDVRWIHSRGRVDEASGNRFVRGAIVDITKLKQAEEAINRLSGKLMNAQEKERARLARELHDGINQSVALLSIKIGMLRNDPGDIAHVRQELDNFATAIERLSEDVHRISYELHPASLNQLGLEAALSSFCRELSAAHGVEIDFLSDELPRDLSPEISLCLYRVAQESLQNVVRHSGAISAHLGVKMNADGVRLVVSDNGHGFEQSSAVKKGGLGLVSIDERVRRLNGRAEVTSTVGHGTRVEVFIPLHEELMDYFPKRLPLSVQIR